MSLPKWLRTALPVLVLLLAACQPSQPDEPPAIPAAEQSATPTIAPTLAATVTSTPEASAIENTVEPSPEAIPEPAQLSFAPATYADESAGFALDYPAEWTLDPSRQVGVRGGQALLLSPGATIDTLAEGGSRISIVTYLWDPKNDLDAFVAQRKTAWEASGFAVNREEQWQLADGRAVYGFVVQMPEAPNFTLFTTVGEDYLQIAGEGDLALVEEILRTLRPLP